MSYSNFSINALVAANNQPAQSKPANQMRHQKCPPPNQIKQQHPPEELLLNASQTNMLGLSGIEAHQGVGSNHLFGPPSHLLPLMRPTGGQPTTTTPSPATPGWPPHAPGSSAPQTLFNVRAFAAAAAAAAAPAANNPDGSFYGQSARMLHPPLSGQDTPTPIRTSELDSLQNFNTCLLNNPPPFVKQQAVNISSQPAGRPVTSQPIDSLARFNADQSRSSVAKRVGVATPRGQATPTNDNQGNRTNGNHNNYQEDDDDDDDDDMESRRRVRKTKIPKTVSI